MVPPLRVVPADADDGEDTDPDLRPGGRDGGRASRVVLLIGLLGAVTAAGIVVGRSTEPAAVSTTTAASTTTTAPRVEPPPPSPPPPPKPVVFTWGPLRAESYGGLPAGGDHAAATVVGHSLAVVGGTGGARVLAGPIGGQLEVVTALRAPLAGLQAFPSAGSLWVVGGEQGGKVTAAVLRINLVSGRIRPSGTFEEPLAEAGVAADGGSAYLVGGWTGDQYATAVLKFTPPSTASLVARIPVGVRSPAVALVGNTLYVAGGQSEQGPSSAVYAVDVASGGVTSLGQLLQPVVGGVLLPVGSKLYLVGGRTTGGKASGAVILIDPATGSSTLAGRIPRPLVGASAVRAGTRALVVDPAAGIIYRVSAKKPR
jgi:hypothetical protein